MDYLITDYLDEIKNEKADKTAFSSPSTQMSFKELREKAQIIATSIIECGLFRAPIALLMPDEVETIVCFMGVAYSGNYYSPIDPNQPIQRIRTIFDILRPKLIITQEKYLEKLAGLTFDNEILIYPDLIKGNLDNCAIKNTKMRMTDADLLYILFTSGSTGIPKGVAVPHKNAVFMTESHTKNYCLDGETIFGNLFPVYFAASVVDIFSTMRNCSSCCMGLSNYYIDRNGWDRFISEKKINTLTAMPATFHLLSKSGVLCENTDIKKIILGGDKITVSEVKRLMTYFPEAKVYSGYGATEIGGYAFAFSVNDWISAKNRADDMILPIGKAFENIDVILVDPYGKRIGACDEGEMYLRFSALPYGYYGNSEKTKETYMSDPTNESYSEVVFKSRDRVFLNEEGYYEHHGRMDFMIKKRGFRIELGEIETCVLNHDSVSRACGIYLDGIQAIILFYVGEIESWDVVRYMKGHLPGYMIPDRSVKLDEMPLNTNGKFDRAKLRMLAEIEMGIRK